MLDRSSKLDDSLMDAYNSIHEIHKGHAAGDSDIEKQASQLASDIRYKAKGKIKDGMNAEDKKRIYLKLLASSPAAGVVKSKAKRKLLGESVLINEIMPAGDTATERTKNVKRVVRGGIGVAKRVAKGVSGIANREGTLSQKVTGAAIDAVKGRVTGAAKKVSNWSKSPTASKSQTASSYKERAAKKDVSKPGDKSGPTIDLKKKKGTTNTYEGLSNWKLELLGEEEYDRMKDKHLEHGGIGAVASKSPSKPYTRSEKPKGDTNYQKEMKAKYGGKLPTAVQVVKDKIKKESGKGAIKETAADKIISSIRSERVDEGKLVYGDFGPYITGQKVPKESRERPLGKVPYDGINGTKKVVAEAKYDNTKSPDYAKKKKALAKKHGGEKNIKGHPQYESALAVDKVIESIKINKASPKSPNCIIMPKKDDITDKAGGKKSTKDVVTKKQKQFFNQEGKTHTLKEFVDKAVAATSKIVKTGGLKKVSSKAIEKVAPKTTDIVKAAPKTTAITKVSPKAIEKVKPKTSTLAKSGTKTSAIKTATQTAVDKVGNKKPPTTAEKQPQKQGNQGNQSKGFNMPKNIKANLKTINAPKNPQ